MYLQIIKNIYVNRYKHMVHIEQIITFNIAIENMFKNNHRYNTFTTGSYIIHIFTLIMVC